MVDFNSAFSIDESVDFTPMSKHCKKLGIAQEETWGTIVAVRFTKNKVFYDILSDYYGMVFKNIDASLVFKLSLNEKEKD